MIWVDWLIILFIVFGIWIGFWRGFLAQIFQIIAIVAALIVAFWIFPSVGGWLETQLHVSTSLARPLSLAVIFLVLALAFQFGASILQKLFAPLMTANPINRAAGAVTGGIQKLLIAALVLTLLVTLPFSAKVKDTINSARLARPLIQMALAVEAKLTQWIGSDKVASLSYRTVNSDEKTTTALNYTVADPTVDLAGEAKMLILTNEIRKKDNKKELVPNLKLRAVAEAHGRDMLAKGYFAHLSPQGKDALNRVNDAHITVLSVGENLANAATPEAAQIGLLASPGHRKNILSADFNQVGISVLDAGTHGKMIVEVFANIP